MRVLLHTSKDGIYEHSEGKVTRLGISEVLKKYGTSAMLALDKGEKVFIVSENKESELNDRPGS